MAQLTGCLDGMGDACRALDFPIVSGNVSLYNETNGVGILPTPTIGGVGVLDDVERHATIALKREGDVLVLVGSGEGWLGQSVYLAVLEGREEGAPPPVDLALERRNGDFVRGLIQSGAVDTAHDLSDGGLAVALAEMAMAGGTGAALPDVPADLVPHAYLFGEDQGRYLLAVRPEVASDLLANASAQGIDAAAIGITGTDRLTLPGGETISLSELSAAHEGWLPAYMASQPAAPAA
jgi:phosphoribosylformylglycinamidine synthase